MTDVAIRECRWCRVRQTVRFDTDGQGRTVENSLACGCEIRRAKGLCVRCGETVVGKSARCESCKVITAREYSRRWRENNPERVAEVQARQAARRRTPEARAKLRERERAHRSRPEVRARRLEQRRARNLADGGARKAKRARAYKERHPDRVKAQQDAANKRRAAAKREYMHLYATKYVGEGKAPVCRQCPNEVPWDGLGRPRLDCFDCRPLDSRERKSPRVVALAESAGQERAA